MLADQVRDYLMYCTHQSDVKAATEFTSGPITISNSEDKEHSVVSGMESRSLVHNFWMATRAFLEKR